MDEKPTLDDTGESKSISNPPEDTSTDVDGGFDRETSEQIHTLARRLTTGSISGEPIVNPFEGSNDPKYDPNSGQFNAEAWTKQLLRIQSRDPERYPARTTGVSFRNLNVHGWGTPTDYQKDVANVWLEAPALLDKVTGRGKRKIQILKDFDGLVRNGEMLVVLGRPGSGCSTFLKTIAGETYGFVVEEGSVLNYQGISREVMHHDFRGEVIYQAEQDIHFGNLTVGQTLSFAAQARTPRNRLPGVTRKQYANHMRDVTMAVFGISHTVHTMVGNDFIRGVSGGERKRVSIAEVTLSGSPLQCWDNSTRGLDSATALEFVKTLRRSTSLSGTTAMVAIYQASQAAYDHFDKVILLYEGRQMYFGHKDSAKKYFTDMGFVCPDRQTTADFLTSLSNPAERIIAPGYENKVPRTPDEFAARWKESYARQQLMEEISAYEAEHPLDEHHLEKFRTSRKAAQAKGMRIRSPYTISVPMQIRLNVERGFHRLRGDMTLFYTTVFGNIVMGLIISSIFYDLPVNTESFFSRGALLFFAILFAAMSSMLEILTLYAQRPIVEKHAKYALYHPFSEAVASMICEMPSKIIVAIVFNLVLYFMTNLRRTPAHFFIYLLFSFLCTLTMSSIFRTIAAGSRTLAQALAPSAVFILALIIYTGFALPIVNMHPWFRWINYVNPIAYAFESLMLNEFHDRRFPCNTFVPQGPGYENATGLERICSSKGAVAGVDYVQGTAYLDTSFRYVQSHMWRNLGILVGFWFFFTFTYLFATEYISAQPSKGEVLVFKRGTLPRQSKKNIEDEESPRSEPIGREPAAEETSDTNLEEKSVAIQKQTAIFHWRDVCYDIKLKDGVRRILNNVDGWVKPGTLTALMGATGAGKTTLLDVLADRVTMGVVTGDMLVDGRQRDTSFQRKTGYVQQQDLHLQTSTVREALRFSALLRQPKTRSYQEKIDYVEEVIKMLDMESYAGAVVGVPGEGLNVEQRKRLTIGVELAARPQLLLFLDEPTSGLDSQTAWSILSLINKLSQNGQAILCTIHQPSAMLFQRFDRLLLLQQGGQTVYFGDIGENSRIMTSYFESYGARPCRREENPAEWMLETIGAAPGSHSDRDWFHTWRNSPQYQEVQSSLDDMEHSLVPVQTTGATHAAFATPFWFQTWVVLRRAFQQYWRTPTYIYSKTFISVASCLFIGFSFWKAGTSQQGLQNQMFAIFMLITIFGNLTQQIMPQFVTQRALYEARERPSKAYSWQAFIVASIFVEIPWNSLMAVLSFFSFYYPVGMQENATWSDAVHERGFLMFLFIWMFFLFTSTFSHMIIAGVETAESGGNLAQLFFSLALIFCGVIAGPETFPHFWIFMYRVSPFNYLVSGVMTTGLADAPVVCAQNEILHLEPPLSQTCGEYLGPFAQMAGGRVLNPGADSGCQYCSIANTDAYLAQIHTNYSERWRNFGLLWVYIVVNIVGAVFFYWLLRVPKGKGKRKGYKDSEREENKNEKVKKKMMEKKGRNDVN